MQGFIKAILVSSHIIVLFISFELNRKYLNLVENAASRRCEFLVFIMVPVLTFYWQVKYQNPIQKLRNVGYFGLVLCMQLTLLLYFLFYIVSHLIA